MRIALENRMQHAVEQFAALIQGAKLDLAVDGDDLERRARGGEIPARISAGEFVSGREVYAAAGGQIFQEAGEAFLERDFGGDAGDGDTGSSGIFEFAHAE